MPTYDYSCAKCAHTFESFQKIDERDAPVQQPCPQCGKRGVSRGVSAPVMGVDAAMGSGSDFKELTRRMSAGLPKRYRENLERAASLKGRKYGAQ